MICLLSMAQKKAPDSVKVPEPVSLITDTLIVDPAKYKVIVIKGTSWPFPVPLLQNPGVYTTLNDFNAVINHLNDNYPAKFVNAFVPWYKQYFGLR